MNYSLSDIELKDVWKGYKENQSLVLRHKLILNYMWLVKYIVQTMSLPVNSILGEEDFINIGMIGLCEAIERYELERGVKFETYALPRVKGIVQDELRRLDWLSRTARKKAHELIQATDELRTEKGREVSAEEIMQKLNINQEEYNSYLAAAAAAKASFSMVETTQAGLDEDDTDFIEEIADTGTENIQIKMENEERINFLTNYIKNLNDRKRLVMMMYYYESFTFKDIGLELGISESRVCQIHTQVINDLKLKLFEFDNS
jgi:RNA polymerase sigma factor for flagellar operon FliA